MTPVLYFKALYNFTRLKIYPTLYEVLCTLEVYRTLSLLLCVCVCVCVIRNPAPSPDCSSLAGRTVVSLVGRELLTDSHRHRDSVSECALLTVQPSWISDKLNDSCVDLTSRSSGLTRVVAVEHY